MPGKLLLLAIALIVITLIIWVVYAEVIAARIARAREHAPDNDDRIGGSQWPGR